MDVHEIPARPGEPAHAHLDLRYLVVAGAGALTRAREEASDLRWFGWDELAPLGLDPGLRRGLSKRLAVHWLSRGPSASERFPGRNGVLFRP